MTTQRLTEFLAAHFPYESGLRRYGRWLVEDTRSLLRSGKAWRHLENQPPATLYVETTNACNANCIFCAYQYQDFFREGRGVMDQELFLRALAEYRELGGKEVSFTPLVGDALLDPHIVERIRTAIDMGFQVRLYTNGLRLARIDCEALVSTGLLVIGLSTAPFKREYHELIYRSVFYEELLSGLQGLLKARNRLGAALRVHIEFRSHVPYDEVLKLPDFRERILPLLTPDEIRAMRVQIKGYDTWGWQIDKSALKGLMDLAIPPKWKKRPCERTFHLTVQWDGKVRACSCVVARAPLRDSDDGLLVGDLNQSRLKEIWAGAEIRRVRRRFRENTLPTICRACSTYRAC